MRLADPRREEAAWALAHGQTKAEASRVAAVNRSTLGRWAEEPSFSKRVEELRLESLSGPALSTDVDSENVSEEAERGLAELVPLAIEIVRAAMTGEVGPGGKIPTTAQHSNALKTIELARKLEPKTSVGTGIPSLGELIREADATRATG